MVRERASVKDASTSGRRRAYRSTRSDGLLFGLDLFLAILLGVGHALPTAYPAIWWLQLLCVAGLAWQVSRADPGRAALVAWVFGTAWGAMGTWWLYISMHQYGGLPSWMAGLAVLALNAVLALYLAIVMAVFARLRRHRALVDALLFAACWMLAELARGVIFTGFPWAASGYAHVESPVANLAPWIGVYGVGFVCAALGAGWCWGCGWPGAAERARCWASA